MEHAAATPLLWASSANALHPAYAPPRVRPFGPAGGTRPAAAPGGAGHDFSDIRVSAERGPRASRRSWGMPRGAASAGGAAPIQRARKKTKYGVAVASSKQGEIQSVKIAGRPAFTGGTKRKLAANPKYTKFHADKNKGTLKPGYSRNHIQAWATVKTLLAQSLVGVKHDDVPDKLSNVMNEVYGLDYNPGKTKGVEAHIKKAGRAMFNHVENLRVDNASDNSSLGSKMKHRLTKFGADYQGAKPNEKSGIWYEAKDEIKQHAIDGSPSGSRSMQSKFGSPMVKLQMSTQLGRRLVETPKSAQKKGKRKARTEGTRILSDLLDG